MDLARRTVVCAASEHHELRSFLGSGISGPANYPGWACEFATQLGGCECLWHDGYSKRPLRRWDVQLCSTMFAGRCDGRAGSVLGGRLWIAARPIGIAL